MVDCVLRLLEEYMQPDNVCLNMLGLSFFPEFMNWHQQFPPD